MDFEAQRNYFRGMNPWDVPGALVGDALSLLGGTRPVSDDIRRVDRRTGASTRAGTPHSTPQRAARPGGSYGTPDMGQAPNNRRARAAQVGYSPGANRTPQQAAYPGESYGLDPRGAPSNNPGGGGGEDPFAALMDLLGQGPQDMSGEIAAGYDAQRQAILDVIPVMQSAGRDATGAMGDYFGYGAQQAKEGRGAVKGIYREAGGNVDAIYDELARSLNAVPGELTDIATSAAGGAVGGRVAETAAAGTAPFRAAGETSRANSKENLTSRSAAGQNYMSQLAAANTSEAGQRQSDVEHGLAMKTAQVQARAAEIEGEKQRAMAEYAADASGDMFNRMLDVMQMELAYDQQGLQREKFDFERGLALQDAQGGGGIDSAEVLRQLRIGEMTDPQAVGGQRGAQQYLGQSGVSGAGSELFESVLSQVQANPVDPNSGRVKSDNELMADALAILSGYTTETETVSDAKWWRPGDSDRTKTQPVGGLELLEGGSGNDLAALQQAFRIMYGD